MIATLDRRERDWAALAALVARQHIRADSDDRSREDEQRTLEAERIANREPDREAA